MRTRLAALWLLAACSHPASGPSAFDRELALLPATAAQYGAPRGPKPRALAPGQWIKQHVVDQDGHHVLITTKLLALFGHQVWLERETESATGTRAQKLLLSPGDRKDARTIDVFQHWVKHPDGRVEQQSMLLGAEKARLQRELGALLVARKPERQEDVAVSAGQFARAYRARVKESALGVATLSDTWWHSEVPFNGTLRTVRVGAPGTSELVGFGLRGASSAF